MDTEKRVKLIEEAIVIMKDLIVRHDERLDEAQAERKASNEGRPERGRINAAKPGSAR